MSSSAEFSRSARELREFLDYEIARRTCRARSPVEWYTKPINRTLPPRDKSPVPSAPAQPQFSAKSPDVSVSNRVTGLRHGTDYAAEYFATTFSAPYRLAMTPKPTLSNCPEPDGLPGPVQAWRPGSPQRSVRPPTGKIMTDVDRMHTMVDEMPVTATSTVALSTPFQIDLAKLRLDRLKIEESHLLEVKRLEELERIRGPKPKWYEMKTPDFHYEAHKNTELVKRRHDYQDLYDYRLRLIKASKQFELERAIAS